MKKIICFLFVMFFSFMLGIIVTNAETENCITIKGANYWGEIMHIDLNCDDYRISDRDVPVKWYYNDTNSTTGGTLFKESTYISGEDNGRLVKSLPENTKGKYIYVEVPLVEKTNTESDPIFVTDITDASTNLYAKVQGRVQIVDNNPYSIKVEPTQNWNNFKITLENATYDTELDTKYFVVFTKDNTIPTINEVENVGCDIPINIDDFKQAWVLNKDNVTEIDVGKEWYMSTYMNAFVIKRELKRYKQTMGSYTYTTTSKRVCEIISKPIKIEAPLPKINERYSTVFHPKSNNFSTSVKFPYSVGNLGTHTIVTKIGLIEDESILKDLAKNTSDCYDKLLQYAKSDNKGNIYKYKDRTNPDSYPDISSYVVEESKFYYVYNTYENNDGAYRNLDGINVFQGIDNCLATVNDWGSYANKTDNSNTNNNTNNQTTIPASAKTEDKTINTPTETPKEEVKTWEYEIKYEANGGEGTMKSQIGKSNEPIVLAKNEFKYEKPKKQIFMGWNLYIEDEAGKREAVKDEKGKMIRFEEGSKVENLKVLSGYKLIAVAEWTPATGALEIGLLIVGLTALMVVGYKYINNKKIISKI